jgi:hypothetical protein
MTPPLFYVAPYWHMRLVPSIKVRCARCAELIAIMSADFGGAGDSWAVCPACFLRVVETNEDFALLIQKQPCVAVQLGRVSAMARERARELKLLSN